jgi:hypothetical protein
MAAITLVPPHPLPVGFGVTPGIDSTNPDATISAQVFGGRLPYQYQWSTGETTPTITAPPGSIVTVLVTDHDGRIGTQTIKVPEPLCIATDLVPVHDFS